MLMSFCKLSRSSRQIQELVVVMKNCFFFLINLNISKGHHFYFKVDNSACTIFSCTLWHTERIKMPATLFTVALKTFG